MTRSTLRNAALTCATQWQWPVVPGAERDSAEPSRCSCPSDDCTVPGAHPLDPVLLAATTDARMVRWWWTSRPAAPLLLATGGRAPCALSLPAAAGARALAALDHQSVRLGPVTTTPTRCTVLVAPYALHELADLLGTYDVVPGSLRFHGDGGYAVLPPSMTGAGQVRWVRRPVAERGSGGAPWLPGVETVLDVLVEASVTTPGSGSTLMY